mmetsp:Transcript_512/g.1993  ORF Transcript_512/g.1993 Transcript_512/m.1993 type:complete len:82 (+) Transcript_512:828-1073(+)
MAIVGMRMLDPGARGVLAAALAPAAAAEMEGMARETPLCGGGPIDWGGGEEVAMPPMSSRAPGSIDAASGLDLICMADVEG